MAALLRADGAGRHDVRRRRAHARPGAAGAYEHYLEGRYHWNRRTPAGFLKAVECFEHAFDHDPHLAPAWAGLADCWAYGPMVATNVPAAEARAKAEAAAQSAITLDPTLAEPYAALGFMRATYASDWAEADALYRRALELKPQLAMAHLHYAGMVLAPTGRLADMAAHQARAAQLDPLSPIVIFATGMVRLVLRQYDGAEVAFRSSLAVDPGFPWAYRGLGEVRLLQGRYAEAADLLERVEMPGIAAGFLGYCYAKLGRLPDARRCLRRLEEPGQPPVWYQVAALHLGLDDIPSTFHALERLCEDRSPGVHWLPVEPNLGPDST